jgi:hypothetical protein
MSNWMSSFMPWAPSRPLWGCMPFPILQGAVNEVAEAAQAPIKMVHHCANNAGFAAVQGLIDFERPDGGIAPVTNISLIIGETGERKSTVDGNFFGEFYNFRQSNSANFPRAEAEHAVRLKVWTMKKKALEKQLKHALDSDRSEVERIVETLIEHGLQMPERTKKITFMYEDTSLASLKRGLANFPSACVHSSEGMSIFAGALFEEKNLLCTLYSGDTYFYDRADMNIALQGRRICVSAHSQPLRSIRHLSRVGDEFRDSGLAARMTVCLLESTQGYRRYDAVRTPTTYRDRFGDRVRDLLEQTLRAAEQVDFERRKVKFSGSAARECLAYANSIEREMRPNGAFAQARDYANRLPEKIGRLAAALHVFEDFDGDISLDTFMAARSIYDQESQDFIYLFNYVPSKEFLAERLLQGLHQYQQRSGDPGVKKSWLLQYGLSNLRKKVALDPILAILEQQGRIHLRTINKTAYVCLGPTTTHFAPMHSQAL